MFSDLAHFDQKKARHIRPSKVEPAPQRISFHTLFTKRAGMPATKVDGFTSLVTTDPAATTAPVPIWTAGSKDAPTPITARSSMTGPRIWSPKPAVIRLSFVVPTITLINTSLPTIAFPVI
ncbi:hypothetical protein CBM2626_A190004 [Cupriavidus taiwanensis]|nr:hypothetical protein CBM2626_A190004 [Cupriavidus taiwanensis]